MLLLFCIPTFDILHCRYQSYVITVVALYIPHYTESKVIHLIFYLMSVLILAKRFKTKIKLLNEIYIFMFEFLGTM
jgi:hypothetical protein